MSAGPDVAGLLEALAALPDRTPQQHRAYALQLDTVRWSQDDQPTREDEDQRFNEAVTWVLEELATSKLSKAARKVIAEALEVEWPKPA